MSGEKKDEGAESEDVVIAVNETEEDEGVVAEDVLLEVNNGTEEEGGIADTDAYPIVDNRSTLADVHVKDHFTLKTPSSSIRFRGSTMLIHELRSSQLHLEEQRSPQGDKEGEEAKDVDIVLKNVKNDKTTGLNLLRLTYTLVCFFFSIILFVVCFQILLFLFMDLVADVGGTREPRNISKFIGTLLALPVFIYGLASAMAIAGALVVDTWNGHNFLKTVGNWDIILTEWAVFIVLLGIPILTWIIVLLAKFDNWWEITALTWFCCVTVYYVVFGFICIFYELQAALLVLRELDPNHDPDENWIGTLRRAVVHRQMYTFSGKADYVRMTNIANEDQVPSRNVKSLYTKMTLASCCGRLFHRVDPAERIYSTEDILGTRQFVTANSWSLEKIFCSNQRTQSVTIVRGPSALLPSQMRSSFICAVGGTILAILLFAAVLSWYQETGLFIFLISLIIALSCIPRIKSTKRIYKMYQDVLEAQPDDSAEVGNGLSENLESDGIYQTFEKYRESRPSLGLCWSIFGLEICLFFIWPLVSVFVVGNYPIAVLFVIVSIITVIRYYLNAAVLVKELGSLDVIGRGEVNAASGPYPDKQWKAKSRLTSILLNVTRGPSHQAWIWVFLVLAFLVIVYAVASLGTTQEESVSSDNDIVILPRGDFAYLPQPNMQYPTCALSKGLEIPLSNATALADYAFLSLMAYQRPDTFQDKLDQWFGPDIAYDDVGTVKNFREQVEGGRAAVGYHLVTFPARFAVVVVRGSTTPWEFLTDAQLWSAVALVDVLRSFLPIGGIWTPILDKLLKAMTFVQSNTLDRVALYKQTTSFIQALENSGNYSNLHICGHSLGGGIALISAAQTGIPGIAISGPNNLLSRKTFDPPLSKDAINKHLFNVVPDRDLVPRTDDLGLLYQRIECRAKKNVLFGCHDKTRSLCEIMYKCGSFRRPPLCDCATKFGYEPAERIAGNQSFTDICGSKRSNDGY